MLQYVSHRKLTLKQAAEALQVSYRQAKRLQSKVKAKGRIERLFGSLQDRLTASLRLAGITESAAANRFLQAGSFEAHNARFAQAPSQMESTWGKAPKPADREHLVSLCYPAKVSQDNCLRLDDMILDIPPGRTKAVIPNSLSRCANCWTAAGEVYYRERVIAMIA